MTETDNLQSLRLFGYSNNDTKADKWSIVFIIFKIVHAVVAAIAVADAASCAIAPACSQSDVYPLKQ